MSKARSLVERIGDIKGSEGKVEMRTLQGIAYAYSRPFSREKVENYFIKVPDCVKWRDSDAKKGQYTFFIEAVGAYFRPPTIGAFIDIMDSIGEALEPNCEDHVVDITKWFL
jgi:hypothetical protein